MENSLQRLAEFQQVLSNYKMSPTSQKVLRATNLALFVAPTSGGRNAIFRELLKTSKYHYVVSDTTRRPRINDGKREKNGHEYWFRTEKQFLTDLKAGNFVEAAIIHGQHASGISIRELRKAMTSDKIAIKDIEIVGAETITNVKPETTVLFILPPNFKEWQRRLKHRGPMSQQELKRRMQSAAKEFAYALQNSNCDFVVNDHIENAAGHIYIRTVHGFRDLIQQVRGRQLCEELYKETQTFLKKL